MYCFMQINLQIDELLKEGKRSVWESEKNLFFVGAH